MSKHGALVVVYGGVLKQGVVRLEHTEDKNKYPRADLLEHYGQNVNAKTVDTKDPSGDYDKVKAKLEKHDKVKFESPCFFAGLNMTDVIKLVKEVTGTDKAQTLVASPSKKADDDDSKEGGKVAKGGSKTKKVDKAEKAEKSEKSEKTEKAEKASKPTGKKPGGKKAKAAAKEDKKDKSDSDAESDSDSDSDSSSGSSSDSSSSSNSSSDSDSESDSESKKKSGKGTKAKSSKK
jgi:hypothetical protein